MTGKSGPVRVDRVLAEVLETHGVLEQVERSRVLERWADIVGEQLAKVTKVKGLDDDALFVEVRSSAWLMELSMMKDLVLGRVNERLGDAPIRRIVFVLAETA
jgi:predicted nucleic acid-binding Zn ribbon protein